MAIVVAAVTQVKVVPIVVLAVVVGPVIILVKEFGLRRADS